MNITGETLENIFRAVYWGLQQNCPNGFDVCVWPDGSVRAVDPGAYHDLGGFPVMRGVRTEGMGFDIRDVTEDQFVSNCMGAFKAGFEVDETGQEFQIASSGFQV
mgnify:CR=1 FL=1